MDLTKFYEDKDRLKYNPRENNNIPRFGIKRFISFDDRFITVTHILLAIIKKFNKYPVKLLDIGIGDAVYESMFTQELKSKIDVYGVDVSQKQLKRAKAFIKSGKVINLDNARLPFKDNFFDIVIISELLEHVFHPENILKEAVRSLKYDGFLILTFPNSGSLQMRLSLLLTGNSPLLNYPQNKEHIRYFSKRNVLAMVGNDLKIVEFRGLGSFLFGKWNFPVKIVTPRFLQIFGNRFLKGFALGNLLLLQK